MDINTLIIEVTDATSQVGIEKSSHNPKDSGKLIGYLAYKRNLSTY